MLTDEQLAAIRKRLYSIYPGLEESIAEGREFSGTGWDAPDMLALLAEIDRLQVLLRHAEFHITRYTGDPEWCSEHDEPLCPDCVEIVWHRDSPLRATPPTNPPSHCAGAY